MSHIFISYKSEQRDFALTVRNIVHQWGYETWLDVDRLRPGHYWADEIDQALKSSCACLAIMTPISLSSRYVTNEWDMAIMRGKLFIPLMFQKTDPHYKYLDIQYVDFTTGDQKQSYDLLKYRLDSQHSSLASNAVVDPYQDGSIWISGS